MKIIHKNEGGKIPYTVSGTRLTIDDQVTYNLARYERDEASHIDVCRDKHGQLVSGVIPGTAEQYVAQIDIPGRTYRYVAEGGGGAEHGARDADAVERGGLSG